MILYGKFTFVYIQLIYSLILILLENSIISYLLLLLSIIIPLVLLTTKDKLLQWNIFILNIILLLSFTTNNILIWYISFELVLIPMIIIISKGSSSLLSKYRTYNRFILYTLISGLLLLINILLIILITGSLNYYSYIIMNPFNIYIQIWLFPIHLLSYIIKLPVIPFHTWLPGDTHGESPTSGSLILAALLLKLGGLGILKWLIPIYPYGYIYYRPLIYLIGVLSTIYASITTIRHIDIKKLIAYSSISHMGLVLIGCISLSIISYKGIIYLLVSHGLVSSLLFILVGSLYIRTGTRIIIYYKGLGVILPILSTFIFISLLLNSSFPPSYSYYSELILLSGTILYEIFGTINVLLALLLSGIYSILLYTRIVYSYINNIKLNDLTLREFIIVVILIITNFILTCLLWFYYYL